MRKVTILHVKEYNPSDPNSYLIYLDANNLYGWAMSQALPECDFHWVADDDLEQLNIKDVASDSDIGYILEVDLEYPQQLHDSHNDYPLAPESMTITDDMLSHYSKKLREKLCIKGQPVRKLVPNLYDKQKYVLHYRNLQFYLSQGMKLSKIHRAIQFKQSTWLKPYIDFNTQKRKEAKNETDKAFFKLANNSVFGRTMMNVRKHVNVELVNSSKRLKKLCAKPTFEAFKIFNEDLAAVHLKKTSLYLNQPVYAGFSILDLSKIVMYDFHYNHIKLKYREKAQLCFTDTDSLCYLIETPNLYADMAEHRHMFDTSNYDKSHPLYSKTNAKVLAKMKDELGGVPMEEFVGLKPKLYSLSYKGKEKQTAKGVSKTVIKKQLRHSLYKDCLFDQKQFRHNMNQIQSQNHQLHTVSINKISLSPYDDKRFVLKDKIHTLAHGHYKIPSTNV
ncbi:uncharacterized protein LOC125381613 isoform X2 [Haliotis rufescens]|uniref:uncharacterized protein LOC124128537 isoform X2 n=1 Tax=Haliotis rufescens TaxID=6454 RepID=UPI00201EE786|nr:uncharacterized protein LOC124128537 isoform X2 [Haliotis rufescens]XP_048254655.1 uncharacterized protein LOC125381613 isoform X2 [Haliotis rufescens]